MGMGESQDLRCWELLAPHQPAQGDKSASITNWGAGMWESQKGPWDAASCGLPALLTQSILFLVPEDLDLRLKSQTDRHPPGS